MVKRVIALVCVVVLVLVITPAPNAEARMRNPNNRIEGIDYTRIKQNENLKLPVIFGFGSVIFNKAELVNGKTLSDKDVDDVIRRVMASFRAIDMDGNPMSMTSGRLYYYQDVIQRAKSIRGEYVKGFDAVSLIRIVGLVFGFDYADGRTFSDMAADFVTGKLVDKIMDLSAPTRFAAEFGELIDDGGMIWEVARELFRMYQENQLAKEAVMHEAMLGAFYDACNKAIAEDEQLKAQPTWKIKCAQTVWRDATLFGVKIKQYWRLTCELTKDFSYASGGHNADWSGRYRGTMRIDVWHDLSTLDEQFYNNVFLSDNLPPYRLITNVYNMRDNYKRIILFSKTCATVA